MRTDSDWPAMSGMGGHFHRMRAGEPFAFAPKRPRVRTVFDRRLQAAVSEWILRELALSASHEAHLTSPQRRLDQAQIARRGYRTWPGRDERSKLAMLAEAEFGRLMEGFPGFYRTQAGEPQLAGPEGLLLAVRNARSDIVGFQVRPDSTTLGKRVWLSSARRRVGTGSGAPAHWAWPRYVEDPFTTYVVEGVLNADICSDKLGSSAIGLSGKTNWRSIDAERLGEELIERVVIALDQDGPASSTREEALRIAHALAESFEVKVAQWDGARAKGFDDCLNDGLPFQIT